VKNKAPRTLRSAAPVKLRETISPRHVADPSLTDKDGKQDAKEDDDEKSELHLTSRVDLCAVRNFMLRTGSGGYAILDDVSRLSKVPEGKRETGAADFLRNA
jgi:hypothetical protein